MHTYRYTYIHTYIHTYIYIFIYTHTHIYAVKLRTGPIFALFKVKNWSIFCFYFWKSHSPCRKKRMFEKQAKKQKTKKRTILKLKTGPIMLRNILGPVFNFNLDQFLTLECCYLFLFFGQNPYFIVFSAKMQNWKKHKKQKWSKIQK